MLLAIREQSTTFTFPLSELRSQSALLSVFTVKLYKEDILVRDRRKKEKFERLRKKITFMHMKIYQYDILFVAYQGKMIRTQSE
jgi:hypothetical protein